MARLDKNFRQINGILNAHTNDATGDAVQALQLGSYASVGSTMIPNIINPAVGWYRIADIDKTGGNSPYSVVFVMTGGQYLAGIPTEYALVATLPGFSSAANARVTQLAGTGGNTGNYNRIRFTQDGNIMHIEVYQTYSANSTRGKQVFWIGALGGELITYSPTAPIAEEPATVLLTYSIKAQTASGIVSVS